MHYTLILLANFFITVTFSISSLSAAIAQADEFKACNINNPSRSEICVTLIDESVQRSAIEATCDVGSVGIPPACKPYKDALLALCKHGANPSGKPIEYYSDLKGKKLKDEWIVINVEERDENYPFKEKAPISCTGCTCYVDFCRHFIKKHVFLKVLFQ